MLYLVKWRGLPYDQSSWEHFRDIRFASDQILDFWDFCRPRPKVSPPPPPYAAKFASTAALTVRMTICITVSRSCLAYRRYDIYFLCGICCSTDELKVDRDLSGM